MIRLLPPTDVRQFEVARPPATANGFGLLSKSVFGFVLGLLFGVGAAFALGALERRIRWSGDVEKLYGQPVLAQVPHARLPTRRKGRFQFTRDVVESFRTLRTNLYMLGRNDGGNDDPARTILVTSAVGGEGKSTVVRNLALAYSEAGARVAIVDADLRNPDLMDPGTVPDATTAPGLAEVIDGSVDLKMAMGTIEVTRNGVPPRSPVEELFATKVERPRRSIPIRSRGGSRRHPLTTRSDQRAPGDERSHDRRARARDASRATRPPCSAQTVCAACWTSCGEPTMWC